MTVARNEVMNVILITRVFTLHKLIVD